MRRLVINKVVCNRYGSIIESRHVHDFQTCQCGDISVDGGLYYLKRTYQPGAKWHELSEWEGGSK